MRVRIGLTCELGHFNYFGDLWEPIRDKDVDKLAERSRLPVACEHRVSAAGSECGQPFRGLAHVEGQEREGEGLARIGGHNVHAGLQSRPKARPQEGPLTPAEWRRRAFDNQRERPGGPALCAVTREPLSWEVDHVHHPVEKAWLRSEGLHLLVWDERNALAIKASIHTGHTSGMNRIPRSALRPMNWVFAREVGAQAVARLEQAHPNRGGA